MKTGAPHGAPVLLYYERIPRKSERGLQSAMLGRLKSALQKINEQSEYKE